MPTSARPRARGRTPRPAPRRRLERDPFARRFAAGLRRTTARTGVVVAGVAVLAVGGGALAGALPHGADADIEAASVKNVGASTSDAATSAGAEGDRTESVEVSRSAARPEVSSLTAAKQKAAAATAKVSGSVETSRMRSKDPRDIAKQLMPKFGFSTSQFSCLNDLWVGESNWRWNADNPTSSAYGIPQALPGSKMASAGADWETNPATQIEWGLGYIKARYGDPCSANAFKKGHNFY